MCRLSIGRSAQYQVACADYLAVLVRTPWFWSKLQRFTRGMGGRRERTRPEQFLALKLPFPPIEQQIRLLPLFAKLRLVGQLQAEMAAELNALLPSVLDRAFSGRL